jgi:hypothetical protein
MPGERPLQTRKGQINKQVWRGKRVEKRALRIKQLEGAVIYLCMGGKWGEGKSKLRREDGKNFAGKNLPMKIYLLFFFVSSGQT